MEAGAGLRMSQRPDGERCDKGADDGESRGH